MRGSPIDPDDEVREVMGGGEAGKTIVNEVLAEEAAARERASGTKAMGRSGRVCTRVC